MTHRVVPRTLLLLRREGRWLLLSGGPRKWFAGRLNGLGGHVEAGEDVQASALREAREETGLEPVSLAFRGTVHVASDPPVMLFVFLGELPPGKVRETDEGCPRWVSDAELADPALPVVGDLRDLIARVRDPGEPFHVVR